MDAYYANCNPNNPHATRGREIRRADYLLWRDIASNYNPETDIDTYTTSIKAALGTTPTHTQARIHTFRILNKLPRLQALVEHLHHLDMYLLTAIANHSDHIDPEIAENPEVWKLIDEGLTTYLTPRTPGQELPSKKNIINKFSRLLAQLNARKPKPHPTTNASYTLNDGIVEGTSELSATLTTTQAVIIDKAVRARAEATNTTRAEALVDLLTEKITIKVNLNLYKAEDVKDAPIMLATGQILSPEDIIWLEDFPTTIRRIEKLVEKGSLGYQVTEVLKAFIEGRDGWCRFPGCSTPADCSDKDHVVNHAEGGPTHPANLASLSRRHHNMKTGGMIRYVMNPFSGDIIWLHPDGTWQISQPAGPLSKQSKRWVRTLNARTQARIDRLWQHTPPTEPDNQDPPPF